MKSYILVLSIILISVCSCKKSEIKDTEVFSPTLKKEILKMIEAKNKGINNKVEQLKVCNVIISHDINKDSLCSILISLSPAILKKTTKFVSLSDSLPIQKDFEPMEMGYTFMKDELIVCYLFSDSCSNKLINISRLNQFKDSIPGYSNELTYNSEFTPSKKYEIVNEDSLRLIDSIMFD